MIVEEKVGDITRAEEPFILFSVNEEGFLDAGLAKAMLYQFPELTSTYPMGKAIAKGWTLTHSDELGGRGILGLQCHSLRGKWDNDFAVESILNLQERVGDPRSRIAIPRIGTGLVGMRLGANWARMRKAFEESPLEFVLYKR